MLSKGLMLFQIKDVVISATQSEFGVKERSPQPTGMSQNLSYHVIVYGSSGDLGMGQDRSNFFIACQKANFSGKYQIKKLTDKASSAPDDVDFQPGKT